MFERRGGLKADIEGERLSKSARHAKWVASPGEHEDHRGQILATKAHDVIRRWADERGATPARIDGASWKSARPLRFIFPDVSGMGLRPIEWSAWLTAFDELGSTFLFQERMKDGRKSDFFRVDAPRLPKPSG